MLRFSDSSHWYRPDNGTPQHDADLREARKKLLYPSVTSIDKDTFPNLFLERWKLNQLVIAASENMRQPHENEEQYSGRIYDISMEKSKEAVRFGKAIHGAIELHPTPPSDISLMPWFAKFEQWHNDKIANVIQNEGIVLDHQIGVAGRFDRIAVLKSGPRAVIDYKTQDVKVDEKGRKRPKFYDSWPRQLAFYSFADAKANEGLANIPECVSLVIDSNEGGGLYEKVWDKEEIKESYKEFVHGAWIWFHSRNYWPVGKWSCDEALKYL